MNLLATGSDEKRFKILYSSDKNRIKIAEHGFFAKLMFDQKRLSLR